MKGTVVCALLICHLAALACNRREPADSREMLAWSAWIEDAAVARGHVKPGDFGQFGCPPGWIGVGDTPAALRGREVSATYVGRDPRPRDGTLTCVAQREFALPPPHTAADPERDPVRRPMTPVWVSIAPDSTTIGFRQEVPATAALYIGQDTPCGPRLIGVRLGDLLKWLEDPQSTTTRDFLGMISAGCPSQEKR